MWNYPGTGHPESFTWIGSDWVNLSLRPGHRLLDLACGKGCGSACRWLYLQGATDRRGPDPGFLFAKPGPGPNPPASYDLCDFSLGDAAEFAAGTKRQWDAVLVLGAMTMIWDSLENSLAAIKPLVDPADGW